MIYKGQCNCLAYNKNKDQCLSNINDQEWMIFDEEKDVWMPAGKAIEIQRNESKLLIVNDLTSLLIHTTFYKILMKML